VRPSLCCLLLSLRRPPFFIRLTNMPWAENTQAPQSASGKSTYPKRHRLFLCSECFKLRGPTILPPEGSLHRSLIGKHELIQSSDLHMYLGARLLLADITELMIDVPSRYLSRIAFSDGKSCAHIKESLANPTPSFQRPSLVLTVTVVRSVHCRAALADPQMI
jgi:hypothetical protein